MINVISNNKKKKCIFYTFEEYKELILALTDGLKEVEYEYDGIRYCPTEKAEKLDTHYEDSIENVLSKYFNVIVTSVHADDSECLGIWICYEDKKEESEQEWIVPVSWGMSGYIKVKASSAEEALDKVSADEEDYPLPTESCYIEGSFTVSFDAEEMVEYYTNMYKEGVLKI